jgi:hypothetical protein
MHDCGGKFPTCQIAPIGVASIADLLARRASEGLLGTRAKRHSSVISKASVKVKNGADIHLQEHNHESRRTQWLGIKEGDKVRIVVKAVSVLLIKD